MNHENTCTPGIKLTDLPGLQLQLADMNKCISRVILHTATIVGRRLLMISDMISWNIARKIVESAIRTSTPIISYIRHKATAELVSKMLGVDIPVEKYYVEYAPTAEDLLLAFKQVRGDWQNPRAEDIDILYIYYFF